jgi:hypothetical protein
MGPMKTNPDHSPALSKEEIEQETMDTLHESLEQLAEWDALADRDDGVLRFPPSALRAAGIRDDGMWDDAYYDETFSVAGGDHEEMIGKETHLSLISVRKGVRKGMRRPAPVKIRLRPKRRSGITLRYSSVGSGTSRFYRMISNAKLNYKMVLPSEMISTNSLKGVKH